MRPVLDDTERSLLDLGDLQFLQRCDGGFHPSRIQGAIGSGVSWQPSRSEAGSPLRILTASSSGRRLCVAGVALAMPLAKPSVASEDPDSHRGGRRRQCQAPWPSTGQPPASLPGAASVRSLP